MEDYEKVYDDFWKSIVENEDGTLNVDQIKRELFDWRIAMQQVSEAYSELTGGLLSKPNTAARWVIHYAQQQVRADIADELEDALDLTPEQIRERIAELREAR